MNTYLNVKNMNCSTLWACIFIVLLALGLQVHASAKTTELTSVDFGKVDWYAKRAAAAYASKSEIIEQFPNTVLVASTEADVQYFLERDLEKKQQIISIRGTANLANAREDAEYLESRNPDLGIFVHNGFDADTMQVYTALLPHLNKSEEVILTGHSLGAAISSLLMMYLHEDGFVLGQSINFGQPKVTNKKGAQKYQFLPLLRVVDENDIVPLVPPDDLIDALYGGYEHFGEEVILLEGEFYVYESKHLARQRSVGAFWESLGDESIPDHFIKNYIQHITPKIKAAQQVPFNDREKYIKE